jgi:penicillin-binding protein 1A
VMEPTVPAGVVNVGGDWIYEEYARNNGIGSVGLDAPRAASSAAVPQVPPPAEERNRILDLFRN